MMDKDTKEQMDYLIDGIRKVGIGIVNVYDELMFKRGRELIGFYLDKLSQKEIVTDVDLNMQIGLRSKLKFSTRTYLEDKEKKK